MPSYSKTSLFKKLGIHEGVDILLIHQPPTYKTLIGEILKTCHIKYDIPQNQIFDFIHVFTKSQEELLELFPKVKEKLKHNGMLWISWPKGACGVGLTNLNENIVRDIGLTSGLVDVKIVSIDEIWSGLKFVYRLKDRKNT